VEGNRVERRESVAREICAHDCACCEQESNPDAERPHPAAAAGSIDIEFASQALITVESVTGSEMAQLILESLRK
jgi:hypothetical protein